MTTRSASYSDAVVIGAGVAGSTAAALLARQGRRVTVIERDVHPGGCAASFEQGGYRFAVGATVGMGFETGGLHHRVYRQLGLDAEVTAIDPAIRVHLPDRVVAVETDRGNWEAELVRAFPGQETAKLRLWRRLARMAAAMRHAATRFPVMPFANLDDVLDSARVLHPTLLPALFALHRTVADLLADQNIDDPAHLAFVNGQLLDAVQATADNTVAANGALALDIYRYGCFYKHGGLGEIARDLLGYVAERGGEVRYATRAKSLLHENGEVRGVATNQGEIHAPVVISAIPLSNTAELLSEPKPPGLLRRSARQAPMWGAFTLYLGVDARTLPDDAHLFEQVTDIGDYHDGGNALISISPPWDPSRAPAGKRAITISTHVDAARWLALEADQGAYAQAKARLEQRLLDQATRALPRLREGIELMQSGSPRTFRRFTLRHAGTVGGFPQTPAHANFQAPSHRTELSGLFLAGDTIFPGQGTLGVTVSGYNAARSAGRFLARRSHRPISKPQTTMEVAA